jgi:hypothetical protein
MHTEYVVVEQQEKDTDTQKLLLKPKITLRTGGRSKSRLQAVQH